MQDTTIDRIKRRRLEGLDEEELARERRLQMAAISDGPNADLANLILRQRFLAGEQQEGLTSTLALQQLQQQQLARAANDPALLGEDPVVAHLRQNILNQQLQHARLQCLDDRSLFAGSSLYGSILGAPRPLAGSLLLDQTLERRQSALNSEQLRALQSLRESERGGAGGETTPAAASLLMSAADHGSQTALLARQMHNDRALAAAGLPLGSFPPVGLHSFAGVPPLAGGGALNRDLLLARGANAGAFLGLPMPGAAGLPPPVPPMPQHHQQQNKKRPAPATHPNMTGRPPIHLFMSCDMDDLSPYQCLVRKQIELFEAEEADAETNARGRNRPIVVGQVGIRCKHCKMLPPRKRERAAIYYPSKLDRLYQAGQTMASVHLGQHCQHIPDHLRQELARLREGKSAALAGKKYWSDGARALGVVEKDDRLFFRKD